jgi:hypothetical protein
VQPHLAEALGARQWRSVADTTELMPLTATESAVS